MRYTELAAELVSEVCERFDLDVHLVREVRVTPKSVEVEVYEVNEQGSKFIRSDGQVALGTRTLPFDSWEFFKVKQPA